MTLKDYKINLREACGYVTQEREVPGFKLLHHCSSAVHHHCHSLTVETPGRKFDDVERAHVF
jgi:hypothetical protein